MKMLIKIILLNILPGFIKKGFVEEGKRLAYEGNNFYCPCCEKGYITFLPFGQKLRLNALCPGCSSLERHRLMWLYLKEKSTLFSKRTKLLHVAPEAFLFNKFKSMQHIDYYPCAKFGEGFEDEYASGTQNVDITEIPYDKDYFDFLICNHVLEHIPDDIQAMKELYRVLKPGGTAILQVPIDTKLITTFEDPTITDPHERKRLFGQVDHVRMYGQDYVKRLENSGFKVNVDKFAGELEHNKSFTFGINSSEPIFLCSKIK